MNPKHWITNGDGDVLLTHRSFRARTAAGCASLVGGQAVTGEAVYEAATRLLAQRVGLHEVFTTNVDGWTQIGLSGIPAYRSIWQGHTDARARHLVLGDPTIQTANFYPIPQLERIARAGDVTDSTLVAMCRMMPSLTPAVPDDPEAVLFDLPAVTIPPDEEETQQRQAEVAAEFDISVGMYVHKTKSLAWEINTSYDQLQVVREVAQSAGSPRTYADIEHLVAAWSQAQRLTPNDAAVEVAARLRDRGLRVGLVADANQAEQEHAASLPIFHLLAYPTWSIRHGRTLPDPALFRAACDDLGVNPARCLYVSNRLHSLVGASGAGLAPVQLGNIDIDSDDPLIGAFPVIDDISRLFDLLP